MKRTAARTAALPACGIAVAVLAVAGGAASRAAPPAAPSGQPAAPSAQPTAPAGHPAAIRSHTQLANRCVAILARTNGRFVAASGPGGYRASARSRASATPFYLKPTGLGRYLLHDRDARLLGTVMGDGASGGVTRAGSPGKATEWRLIGRAGRGGNTNRPGRTGRAFTIASTLDGRRLAVGRRGGRLKLAARSARRRARTSFVLVRDRGCRPYPEAGVGATGEPFSGTRPDGTVLGFADTHLHLIADLRAGGDIIAGKAFARFGITRALGAAADARKHSADGGEDVTGNLLRSGLPFGTHDIHGWPSFAGWPVNDTVTHQQAYYVWLERAWMAGLRLIVAQVVEDEPICRIEPTRTHSCDETHTIRLEIQRLRRLERYVDAQSGGPGRGWLRLVYNPRQARRAIERGKLAVVIGVESSNPLGCAERIGEPRCTRADVDRGLEHLHRLGVRSLFVAHWVDNAFAGPALEGGVRGVFINILNAFQTGAYFSTETCPEPGEGEEVETLGPLELGVLADFFPAAAELAAAGMPTYPPGPRCNARGLTGLGRYLVRRMIARQMLIEVDHLSESARERVLTIAERHRYPVVSSHNGTGGAWTPAQLRRLHRLGGVAAATPDPAPQLAAKIERLAGGRSGRRRVGVPLGTDTGGFAELPGPREDAAENPLRYPFDSYDGEVEFTRQRSGERFYDLNTDGVAHYGLIADLIADMQRDPRARRALPTLFRSAEAYLQMWERAARPRRTR